MSTFTQSQLNAIKADIASKANTTYNGVTFANLQALTRLDQIAQYYNDIASPQVDIWRPDLTVDMITNVIVMADFIALSSAKQQAWFAMSQATFIDATSSVVRTNFVSIFGNGTTTTNSVTAIAKKAATNLESLFTVSSVSSMYKVILGSDDILSALRS